MKKTMKSMLCLLLVAVMTFGLLPTPTQAASVSYVEVTKNNAPIRSKDRESGSVVGRCAKGTILEVTGTTYNCYLNKWYKVNYDGKTRYIYSENVKTHNHDFRKVDFDDVVYRICRDCGAGNVIGGDKKKGTALLGCTLLAMPIATMSKGMSATTFGIAAAADGPMPYGEMVAAGLGLAAIYYAAVAAEPTVESAVKLFSRVDFEKYLEKREENICSPGSFRLVKRVKGGLKYVGNHCLEIAEAYVFVLAGFDVYTADEDMALLLAAQYGSAVCERDKDKISHFWHYHFGTKKNRPFKSHIFFDLNDLKQGPM